MGLLHGVNARPAIDCDFGSYREVLRCLLEGVQWLLDLSVHWKVAGKCGISQAQKPSGRRAWKEAKA